MFFWENHKSEGKNAPENVMLEQPFFSPNTNQASSPHCLQIILVHHLATTDKFIMNYKWKNSQHHFHIGLNFLCFFGSGWLCWDPLHRLGFCYNIIGINPSFVTSDCSFKFSSAFAQSTSFLLTSTQYCFWSSVGKHGTYLNAKWSMPKFSMRISWHTGFEIRAASISWTVKWQLEYITLQTFGCFLFFLSLSLSFF